MPTYHLVYGGRKHIVANSEEDAYTKFWAWVIEAAQQGNVGLIVEIEDEAGSAMVDLGANDTVVCDGCHQDYSASGETGGVLIGSNAYGPCCAQKKIDAQYAWPSGVKMTKCPDGMSFLVWILSLR